MKSMSPSSLAFAPLTAADLARTAAAPLAWLWHGYLAPGRVTLLTSQWKMGKTTLLAALLAKMQAGSELAGREVAPGRAVVVSEEHPSLWADRMRRFGLGGAGCWRGRGTTRRRGGWWSS